MLTQLFSVDKGKPACPIWGLTPATLKAWKNDHAGRAVAWLENNQFTGQAGQLVLIPDKTGGIEAVVQGLGAKPDPLALAALTPKLPAGTYRVANDFPEICVRHAELAWALGSYKFTDYKTSASDRDFPSLTVSKEFDLEALQRQVAAVFKARDLINTPAADMGPSQLHAEVASLAEKHSASFRAIIGDDLLEENFPLLHAVGRAAIDPPQYLELIWGDEAHPEICLVGKGVCFDTGGLNLKPGTYMDLMKKDMGGAAVAIALAGAILDAELPVRLRLLVGAVENAIGPDAFRPGDILKSRKGLTVEIGNTDAEGRLVLADLLSEAESHTPDLILDFATLTGAARVALGPEVIPFYTHDESLADALQRQSKSVYDPLWQMPLWHGYDGWLSSSIADVNHISSSPMAGSITAALFLSRFVPDDISWAHFDIYGWNIKARAGRPIGGEAHALRAAYAMIEERYGQAQ